MKKESEHIGAYTVNRPAKRNTDSKTNDGSKPRLRRARSPEAAPPAASPPTMTQWAAEDTRTSAQLLLDHYAGNNEAFERFFEENDHWMHTQVRKFGLKVDVEDVVQRIGIRIYRQGSHVQRLEHAQHHHSLHGHAGRGADDCPACVGTHGEVKTNGWYDPSKGNVRAWLYVALWHEAVSQLRQSRRTVSFDVQKHGGVYDYVEESLMQRERLEHLSDRDKHFIEAYAAGKTYEEIAELLHCSIGTISNIRHRLEK